MLSDKLRCNFGLHKWGEDFEVFEIKEKDSARPFLYDVTIIGRKKCVRCGKQKKFITMANANHTFEEWKKSKANK